MTRTRRIPSQPSARSFSLAGAVVSPPRTSILSLPPSHRYRKKKWRVPTPYRFLMTPIELIKIQQQKQQQHLYLHHHHTTHDVAGAQRTSPARAIALHVYRVGGIRGLYRGLSATILRDVGGYGLYFFGVCLPASSAINYLTVFRPTLTPVRRHAAPPYRTCGPRRDTFTPMGTASPRRWRSGNHWLAGNVPLRRD